MIIPHRLLLGGAIITTVALVGPSLARAQANAPSPRPKTAAPQPTRPPADDGYGGVVPGDPQMPRFRRRPRHSGKRCYVFWTGFQLLPTGSRLFILTNKPIAFQASAIKADPNAKRGRSERIVVRLEGCRVWRYNNSRRLWTEFFPTPVLSARLRNVRGGAAEMTIILRKPSTFRTEKRKMQSWYYLFIAFPPTTYTPVSRRLSSSRRRLRLGRRGARRGRGRRSVPRVGPSR